MITQESVVRRVDHPDRGDAAGRTRTINRQSAIRNRRGDAEAIKGRGRSQGAGGGGGDHERPLLGAARDTGYLQNGGASGAAADVNRPSSETQGDRADLLIAIKCGQTAVTESSTVERDAGGISPAALRSGAGEKSLRVVQADGPVHPQPDDVSIRG